MTTEEERLRIAEAEMDMADADAEFAAMQQRVESGRGKGTNFSNMGILEGIGAAVIDAAGADPYDPEENYLDAAWRGVSRAPGEIVKGIGTMAAETPGFIKRTGQAVVGSPKTAGDSTLGPAYQGFRNDKSDIEALSQLGMFLSGAAPVVGPPAMYKLQESLGVVPELSGQGYTEMAAGDAASLLTPWAANKLMKGTKKTLGAKEAVAPNSSVIAAQRADYDPAVRFGRPKGVGAAEQASVKQMSKEIIDDLNTKYKLWEKPSGVSPDNIHYSKRRIEHSTDKVRDSIKQTDAKRKQILALADRVGIDGISFDDLNLFPLYKRLSDARTTLFSSIDASTLQNILDTVKKDFGFDLEKQQWSPPPIGKDINGKTAHTYLKKIYDEQKKLKAFEDASATIGILDQAYYAKLAQNINGLDDVANSIRTAIDDYAARAKKSDPTLNFEPEEFGKLGTDLHHLIPVEENLHLWKIKHEGELASLDQPKVPGDQSHTRISGGADLQPRGYFSLDGLVNWGERRRIKRILEQPGQLIDNLQTDYNYRTGVTPEPNYGMTKRIGNTLPADIFPGPKAKLGGAMLGQAMTGDHPALEGQVEPGMGLGGLSMNPFGATPAQAQSLPAGPSQMMQPQTQPQGIDFAQQPFRRDTEFILEHRDAFLRRAMEITQDEGIVEDLATVLSSPDMAAKKKALAVVADQVPGLLVPSEYKSEMDGILTESQDQDAYVTKLKTLRKQEMLDPMFVAKAERQMRLTGRMSPSNQGKETGALSLAPRPQQSGGLREMSQRLSSVEDLNQRTREYSY